MHMTRRLRVLRDLYEYESYFFQAISSLCVFLNDVCASSEVFVIFLKLCQLIEQHKTHVMSERKLGVSIRSSELQFFEAGHFGTAFRYLRDKSTCCKAER